MLSRWIQLCITTMQVFNFIFTSTVSSIQTFEEEGVVSEGGFPRHIPLKKRDYSATIKLLNQLH